MGFKEMRESLVQACANNAEIVRLNQPQKLKIPVLSGLTGTGKTVCVEKYATEKNYELIRLNCSNRPSTDLSTHLCNAIKRIEKDEIKGCILLIDYIDEADDKWLELFDQYANKRFDAIINIGHDNYSNPIKQQRWQADKIPEGLLIIGEQQRPDAINPEGSDTQELTEHRPDVLDFIEVKPSWGDTLDYIKYNKQKYISNRVIISDSARDEAIKFITSFIENYKTSNIKIDEKLRYFYIKIGDDDVYFSPRRISSTYEYLAACIQRKINFISDCEEDIAALSNEKIEQYKLDIKKRAFDAIWHKVLFYQNMYGKADKATWENDIFVRMMEETEVADDIFRDNSDNPGKLKLSMVSREYLLNDQVENTLLDEPNFIEYIKKVDADTFKKQLDNLISQVIDNRDPKDDYKYFCVNNSPVVYYSNGKLLKDNNHKVSLYLNYMLQLAYAFKIHHLSSDFFQILIDKIHDDVDLTLHEAMTTILTKIYMSGKKNIMSEGNRHIVAIYNKRLGTQDELRDKLKELLEDLHNKDLIRTPHHLRTSYPVSNKKGGEFTKENIPFVENFIGYFNELFIKEDKISIASVAQLIKENLIFSSFNIPNKNDLVAEIENYISKQTTIYDDLEDIFNKIKEYLKTTQGKEYLKFITDHEAEYNLYILSEKKIAFHQYSLLIKHIETM